MTRKFFQLAAAAAALTLAGQAAASPNRPQHQGHADASAPSAHELVQQRNLERPDDRALRVAKPEAKATLSANARSAQEHIQQRNTDQRPEISRRDDPRGAS